MSGQAVVTASVPRTGRWNLRGRAGERTFHAVTYAGGGAFSQVWQVRDEQSGELFALKELRAEWDGHKTARQLFANEAEIGQKLNSSFVVRISQGQLQSVPRFLLMEWMVGQTLETLLSAGCSLPVRQTVWIARQCAQGMTDLAAAGFMHGDIKPSNVFLCQTGQVKLIDLGFAHPISAVTAEITGTLEYLAPESLARVPSGIARDLYSLGVMLFRMLTGRLPFAGETAADVAKQQQESIAPAIRSLNPGVPLEVAALVQRLLSKQPLRRAAGLADLVRELISLEISLLSSDLRLNVTDAASVRA